MKPPDLQIELVAMAGGYDKITPAQWAAFDRAMADYQRTRREAMETDFCATHRLATRR
jgi:hypothetical protein